jgi:hypothetical protein
MKAGPPYDSRPQPHIHETGRWVMKIRAESGEAIESTMDWLAQLHDDGGQHHLEDYTWASHDGTDAGPGQADGSAGAQDGGAGAQDGGAGAQDGSTHAGPRHAGGHAGAQHGAGYAGPRHGAVSEPAGPATGPAADPRSMAETGAGADLPEPAPIGDELRIPIAWCEMGSCISHHADPAALGEADIRARAIAAGWRVDAVGRLACQACQQRDSWFWTSRPLAPWNRDQAVTVAALLAAATREDAPGGPARGKDAGVLPAARPAVGVLPGRGRHRARAGRAGRAGGQEAHRDTGLPWRPPGAGPAEGTAIFNGGWTAGERDGGSDQTM